VSTTSSNGGSAWPSTFSPSSLTRGYNVPPPPSSSSPSSFFFFFSSSDYIDDQSTREREREESVWLPLLYDYHHSSPHLYSSFFFSRANVSDTCLYRNCSTQTILVDISFLLPKEQYFKSLKNFFY
jgi:hypothetical protein